MAKVDPNNQNQPPMTNAQKASLLRNMGPNLEQQSMGFVQWNSMGSFLGQPFDSTSIPLSKLRQMRRDPMIAFGLQFVKLPLIRAPWFIECENPQVAAFITEALKLIYERLMMQVSLKYDYGYQAIIKNFTSAPVDWTYNDVQAGKTVPVWNSTVDPILWKPFTSVPPEHVTPEWAVNGDFNGFYTGPSSVPGAKVADPNNPPGYIDVGHALWVTNEKDSKHGSIWGYPRIGYAYRYWWSYWYGWALRDRHMERLSDPSVLVRYPNEVINDSTGQQINTRAIAEGLGQNIRAGQTVSLPNSLIKDAEGRSTNVPEWDIKYLESQGNTASEFQSLFDYLDVMKLRSILVPEQALINGSGAQSSRGVAEQLADFFTESQATEMVEFGDLVNRYLIPQLVAINFPLFKGKCRWVSRGFSSVDQTLIMQLLTLIGQANPDELPVDVTEVLNQLQVPVKSPEQVKQEQADELQQQEAQLQMQAKFQAPPGQPGGLPQNPAPIPPPSTPKATSKKGNGGGGGQYGPQNTDWQKYQFDELEAIPGVRSGIDRNGNYYAPRERINLGPAYPMGPFAKKIKNLRYFSGDDEALEAAHEIYEIWQQAYSDYYAMVSSAISKMEFAQAKEPSSQDPATHIVNQTVEAATAIFTNALTESTDLMKTIASSAATKEMTAIKFDVNWKTDNTDIQNWMKSHGGQLIRNVTDSTRKEVTKFLAEQLATDSTPLEISKAIDENFSQWPTWKAERLARSEARDAYNAGTLLSAQQNGITHAQASDASGGRNLHTDQPCIERNGKIFTLAQALMEQDHPNGTLVWRPIPPGISLSIEHHSPVVGPLAYFDENEGIIHLSEDITQDQEREFLTAVVDTLRGA